MVGIIEIEEKRFDEIAKLMDAVDISIDCTPGMIGSVNTVVADGGSPTEEAIKLMVIKERGEIDMDEYLAVVSYFAEKTVRQQRLKRGHQLEEK